MNLSLQLKKIYPKNLKKSLLRSTSTLKPFKLSIFFAIFAFVISIYRGINSHYIPDSIGYLNQAEDFLKGWNFINSNPEKFTHGIGFSLLISATYFIQGNQSLYIFKAILAICHGLSSYLVYKIGEMIDIKRNLLLFVTIAFAIDPFVLISATDVQTETFTSVLALYWCWVYLSIGSRSMSRHIIVLPLSGLFSVLIRPNSLIAVVLVLFITFKKVDNKSKEKLKLKISAIIFLAALILYEILLYKIYKGFVFLSPIGGVSSAYMCREEFIPQYLGIANAQQNAVINSFAQGGGGISEIISNARNLNVSQLNDLLFNIGKENCLSNPFKSGAILILKFLAVWRPFTVYGAYSPTIFLISLVLWLPLTLTLYHFLIMKVQAKTKDFKNFFIILAFGYSISLLLTPIQIRHRVAFAESFMWIIFIFVIEKKIKYRKLNYDNGSE